VGQGLICGFSRMLFLDVLQYVYSTTWLKMPADLTAGINQRMMVTGRYTHADP